jgi:hypothetical protein
MDFFKNTRLKIARAILKKRVSRNGRKMAYKNFSEVKNIGIVWNASNHGEFQSLARFHQNMNDRNIDVKIIGYYNGKHLPDQYTAIRYLSCFKKSETSIFYIPDSAEARSFAKNKFEILIDINFDELFPLNYITEISQSLFKVGLFNAADSSTPFDLLMDIKKPVNIDDYLKQVIRYLEMIKS